MKLRIETEQTSGHIPFDMPYYKITVHAPVGPYGRYVEVSSAMSALTPLFAKEVALAQAVQAIKQHKGISEKQIEYVKVNI